VGLCATMYAINYLSQSPCIDGHQYEQQKKVWAMAVKQVPFLQVRRKAPDFMSSSIKGDKR
jgi:hypothetical protein